MTNQNQTVGSLCPFLLPHHSIHFAMDFNTITTPSASYDAAMWICLTLLMLLTIVIAAYNTPWPCVRHYDMETGTSVQFSHTLMLTTLTTTGQSEDDLGDSSHETSSFIQSMYATTSHVGDANSEWSEETNVSSELSEEDVTNALPLIAMPLMNSLGPLSIEGEQGSTPCSPYYSSNQSGVESSQR